MGISQTGVRSPEYAGILRGPTAYQMIRDEVVMRAGCKIAHLTTPEIA